MYKKEHHLHSAGYGNYVTRKDGMSRVYHSKGASSRVGELLQNPKPVSYFYASFNTMMEDGR